MDDECLNVFQELKLRKKSRFITYKLSSDNRTIVVEKEAKRDAKYDEFATELPDDDCRYAVYDFEYEKSPQEGVRSKIIFIVW